MEIRKMTARFGALRGESLELEKGLNIISAPNESGKSTWCAFMKAMLYGVDSAQRARAGVLPDKKRYAPWDGGAMAGEMELTWQGKEITLARSGRASAPMREFSAVYTGTGLAVPELTGASAGETLTGVPRAVFESSAFIGQSALRVTQGPELEKRIAAIVSTGEEDVSFSETESRLAAWQRKRRWRTSGQLPEIEARLEEKTAALDAINRSGDDCETLGAEAEALERRCETLRRAVTDSRKTARREALDRSRKSREALREAEQVALDAQAREQILEERLDGSCFGREEPARTAERVDAALAQARTLRSRSQDRPASTPGILLLVLAAVLLAAGAALLFSHVPLVGVVLVALGVIAAAVGAVLLRQQGRRIADAQAAARELLELLESFGVADEAALTAAAEAHEALYRDWQDARIESARKGRLMAEAQTRQSQLDAAVLEELDFTGGSGEAARLGRELAAAEAELRVRREALAQARGRTDVMGDPMALESEIGQLRERRSELQMQYEALGLALDALREADQEIQTRFSPRLGARASELFALLTGGKYDRLALDKTLDAQARPAGDAAAHEAAYLSAGALDQLYLALRLAICELAMPQEEKCPLVLDDVLGNFDDARCAAALDLLKTLARERQILLFTCHSREAAYFAGDPEMHVTRLDAPGGGAA